MAVTEKPEVTEVLGDGLQGDRIKSGPSALAPYDAKRG